MSTTSDERSARRGAPVGLRDATGPRSRSSSGRRTRRRCDARARAGTRARRGLRRRGLPARGRRPRRQVYGLDASEELLAIARTRVPEAELTAGDLQFLPYDDDGFDVVCDSLFFAADMTAACARRAASTGAPASSRWGRPSAAHRREGLVGVHAGSPPPRCGAGELEAIASDAVATDLRSAGPASSRHPALGRDAGAVGSRDAAASSRRSLPDRPRAARTGPPRAPTGERVPLPRRPRRLA